jgi:hypothetical protein
MHTMCGCNAAIRISESKLTLEFACENHSHSHVLRYKHAVPVHLALVNLSLIKAQIAAVLNHVVLNQVGYP